MIKVGSDFSGIGAFKQALIRLGIVHKQVFACDLDRFVRKSYIANYGEPDYYPKNVYDREIPEEPLDIYCSTAPCQSFSIAGKRGGEKDKRGILFYSSHKLIKKNLPRFFVMENVPGLLSDDRDPKNPKAKYGRTFNKWLQYLGGKSINGNPVLFPIKEAAPYHIYHTKLNAKDFGIPQNRERVFIVGIRDDEDNHFTWPKPFELVKRLKDVLEDEVDEKYFLSDTMVSGLIKTKPNSNRKFEPKTSVDGVANCIGTKSDRTESTYIKVGYINQDTQASQVYDSDGDTPSLSAGTHGYAQGYIAIKSANSEGYEMAGPDDSINYSVPNSKTRRGRVGKGVAQTLDTACKQGVLVQKPYTNGNSQGSRVYDTAGETPAVMTNGSKMGLVEDWHQLTETRTEEAKEIRREYLKKGVDFCPRRAKKLVPRTDGIGNTITAGQSKEQLLSNGFRIRRLTPRECLRLMDFPDSYKIEVSDTQAYKQAGNSVCVGVYAEIIKRLPL